MLIAAVELVGLPVEVGFGDQQTFLNAVDGGQDVFAHGTDAGIQIHDHRVGFRRIEQQAVALEHHFVILADKGGQGLVGQADVDGQHGVELVRSGDIFA